MQILLLGSGGREHAFAKKITASKHCTHLYIAPGNAGTLQHGTNVPLNIKDFEAIGNYCLEKNIELVIVGPEEPLVLGIVDYFTNTAVLQHIQIVGPNKMGAQLEGSKDFSKKLMHKYGIPTAASATFNTHNFADGIAYIQQHSLPIVLKADGLAAGKGVLIINDTQEAIVAFTEMIQEQKFGSASATVVIEQFLDGIEMSVFAIVANNKYVLLPNAKDYKRIGEGDVGLNTGGMGAISPVPFANDAFMQKVISTIVEPTVDALVEEQINYNGFIFFGLIKVNNAPYVIEYNARMGDPETETVLPRLESDLVELFLAMKNGNLNQNMVQISEQHACTIVCVSGGYPVQHTNGYPIANIETITTSTVYHAGTAVKENVITTNGGRVLAITSLAPNLKEAIAITVANASVVTYIDKFFRKDIGWEFE